MIKLALGTAQFGFKYGVSNKFGKIKYSEANKILQLAKKANFEIVDTAISYGDSEKVIGDIGIKDFKYVSKLPNIPSDCEDTDLWVEKNVHSSLKLMGIPSLYGLLVHNYKDLLGKSGKKLIKALQKMKLIGLVKKIGISIYDPNECDQILHLTRFDIVQAPLNIVDQRFFRSGWLSRLHSEEIEIHTRSVFLQGLLLMPRTRIPNKFNRWSHIWDQWSLELKKNNLTAIEVCLSYPLSLPEINHVIVGVENVDQLDNIIKKSKSKIPQIDWSFMNSNDAMLVNPFNWSKL